MMRKTVFAFLLALLCGRAAKAETPPDVLYASVIHSTGLNFPGVKPWHIKVSYSIAVKKGQPTEQGVFEEWWVSPHKYKLSYSRPGFKQTDYATDAGLYRVGDQQWPGGRDLSIPQNLFDPSPNLLNNSGVKPQMAPYGGSEKLRCIALTYPVPPTVFYGAAVFPTYCIDQTTAVLRLIVPGGPGKQITFNRIAKFQGHYVAGDIETTSGGTLSIKTTVDALEVMQPVDDAIFTPPTGASPLSLEKITLSEPLQVMEIGPVDIPTLAQSQHATGEIKLRVTVDRTGHVVAARVTSGPALLQQMVLDSIKQWTFRPFLVMGEPVAVDVPFYLLVTK